MEQVREIKITVYIDTDELTYTEEFDDMYDALNYWEDLMTKLGWMIGEKE